MTKINVIVTGATGMVGEGVMHECLWNPNVESVLVINRKPGGVTHPKLKEIVHKDFFDLSAIESQLSGYNACYFCLGVTSVGKKEPEYYRLTYTLTIHVGETLARLNPDMTFNYVSGSGTDNSEQGKRMWARVKGKTENDLAKLPFKQFYAFRPAYINPMKNMKHTHAPYKILGWLYPVLKMLIPNAVNTLEEVSLAMIAVTEHGYPKRDIECKDISILAKAE
jgi:uncharacterized protein YbjT (DUF2867 family)